MIWGPWDARPGVPARPPPHGSASRPGPPDPAPGPVPKPVRKLSKSSWPLEDWECPSPRRGRPTEIDGKKSRCFPIISLSNFKPKFCPPNPGNRPNDHAETLRLEILRRLISSNPIFVGSGPKINHFRFFAVLVRNRWGLWDPYGSLQGTYGWPLWIPSRDP